jgi:hypothetical protein
MSQAGRFSSGIPVGTVTQIDGDTGFATGPIINLVVGQSFGTSRFIGDDANTINLEFSDADNNTGIGANVLIQNPHGVDNVALGDFALTNCSGTDNVAVGVGAGSGLTASGNFNVILGSDCGSNFTGGSFNFCAGNTSGNAMATTESNNIYLNSTGVVAQSNTLRIGQATGTGTRELSTAFICGIEGVDVGSVATIVTVDADQLGSATITAGSGISVTPGANTITIASTGGGGTLDTLTGDTGGAVSPTASNINVLGAHGINTSGSGSTLTVAINNAITLGDLTLITAGNPALTLTSGDLTISGTGTNAAGNVNIPVTTTTGRSGVIEVNGNRFIHSFGSNNVFTGVDSGNFTLTGDGNSSFGVNSSQALTIGAGNSAFGYQTLLSGAAVNFNIAIGASALLRLIDSDNNVAIGVDALINSLHGESNLVIGRIGSGVGNSYTGSESHNVLIQNVGVLGESNTMRIGTTGSGTAEQNRTFLAGVQGVNVGSTATVVTMVSEQMGTATITAGTGITVTPGANTITIASSGGGGGFTSIVTQTFTSSGTYTPTTGMAYCLIEAVGGGGGGGGTSTGLAASGAGGGGGAGGYTRKVFSSSTIGSSQSVTVGTGGAGGAAGANPGSAGVTTTVGSLLSATAGSGGLGATAAMANVIALGGAGGVGSLGDLNLPGQHGFAGFVQFETNANAISGTGGSSIYAAGAVSTSVSGSNAAAGSNGTGYGAGGSGGANSNGTSAQGGGSGSSGIVIVTEYII